VVCYEIWARSLPWRGESPVGVAIKVASGDRLLIPHSAPEVVKAVMERCQRQDPHERPTMAEIVNVLKCGDGAARNLKKKKSKRKTRERKENNEDEDRDSSTSGETDSFLSSAKSDQLVPTLGIASICMGISQEITGSSDAWYVVPPASPHSPGNREDEFKDYDIPRGISGSIISSSTSAITVSVGDEGDKDDGGGNEEDGGGNEDKKTKKKKRKTLPKNVGSVTI